MSLLPCRRRGETEAPVGIGGRLDEQCRGKPMRRNRRRGYPTSAAHCQETIERRCLGKNWRRSGSGWSGPDCFTEGRLRFDKPNPRNAAKVWLRPLFGDLPVLLSLLRTRRFPPRIRGLAEFNGLAFRFRTLSDSHDILVSNRRAAISGQNQNDRDGANQPTLTIREDDQDLSPQSHWQATNHNPQSEQTCGTS